MQIGAKWLVLVAGAVSTLTSFLGGYLMYDEGLSLLEKTVEEVGLADAQALHREATRIFNVNDEFLYKYWNVMQKYTDLPSREDLAWWVRVHGLAEQYNGDTLSGLAIIGMDPLDQTHDFVYYVWVDYLRTGVRQFIYADVIASIDTEECPSYCAPSYIVDPVTAALEYNVYNVSDPTMRPLHMAISHEVPPGSIVSDAPALWSSSDGNPYISIMRTIYLPPIDHGLYKGMVVFTNADLATFPFDAFMDQYNTDANIILTQLADGLDSMIMSANFAAGRVDRNCTYNPYLLSFVQPCIKTVRNLSSDHQAVVTYLNTSADWTFSRTGDFWALRAIVFKKHQYDRLQSIYLMWYRSVSKVRGDMNRALYLFIGFLAGVLVFDVLIGVCEILLIARPLMRLADATGPLRMMQLEDAAQLVGHGADTRGGCHEGEPCLRDTEPAGVQVVHARNAVCR